MFLTLRCRNGFLWPVERAWDMRAIQRRIRQKYATRSEEIVAGLRDAAGAAPPIDPVVKVKRLTAEVAIQMALIHGGDWRVLVDHETRLVMVAPSEGQAGTR